MRRLASIAMLGLIAAVGCGGSSDEDTPVACLEGDEAYLSGLEQAPGEVRLGGETPISDCLVENQTGADLAEVGAAMLSAATTLNSEARADPGGGANLQLGYLLGAAERGAEESEGIHADLLRRLASAARYSPDNQPLPPAFQRAYERGYDAGFDRG